LAARAIDRVRRARRRANVPVDTGETRVSYGAIAVLERWLDAKHAREARAAEAADREAAETVEPKAEERLQRAAARAARSWHSRESRPGHLRSVEGFDAVGHYSRPDVLRLDVRPLD